MQEVLQDGKLVQAPVYYASKALAGPKLHYFELEKLAYAVVMASHKLKHYFTGHPITVPTSLPLRDVLKNREAVEQLSKWAPELAPYHLNFKA
jgi:hypothetical protein